MTLNNFKQELLKTFNSALDLSFECRYYVLKDFFLEIDRTYYMELEKEEKNKEEKEQEK